MGFSPRRLTQRFVESLTWTGKRLFVRDSDLKGFMVVVNRTKKSYMIQRDLWRGPRGNRKLIGPRRVLLGDQSLESFEYSAKEKLLWIRFENDTSPRSLTVEF